MFKEKQSHLFHISLFMIQQPKTNIDVDTTALLYYVLKNNTQFMYCQLAIKLSDHINKISNQNSHILK